MCKNCLKQGQMQVQHTDEKHQQFLHFYNLQQQPEIRQSKHTVESFNLERKSLRNQARADTLFLSSTYLLTYSQHQNSFIINQVMRSVMIPQLFISNLFIHMALVRKIQTPRSYHTTPDNQHDFSIPVNRSDKYQEMSIETKDEDLPLIIYYKPKIRKQQKRNQASLMIQKIFQRIHKAKLFQGFNKLTSNTILSTKYEVKVQLFSKLFQKIAERKKQQTVTSLICNKIKSKQRQSSCKIMSDGFNLFKLKNLTFALSSIKIYGLQNKIKKITNQSILAQELENTKKQLNFLKQNSFTPQFIQLNKNLQKMTSQYEYLQVIQNNGYLSELQNQIRQFQQKRNKLKPPKRNEIEDNQSVAIVIKNTLAASNALIHDYSNQIIQLHAELENYKNAEGINELKEILRQKQQQITGFQQFVNEITRMDREFDKFIGEKLNTQKVVSIINSQEKKMQNRVKNIQENIGKIYASRQYFSTLACDLINKINQSQDSIRSQFQTNINSILELVQQPAKLTAFMKKNLKNSSLGKVTQLLIEYVTLLSSIQGQLQGKISLKDAELNSLRDKLQAVQNTIHNKDQQLTNTRKQNKSIQKDLKTKQQQLASTLKKLTLLQKKANNLQESKKELNSIKDKNEQLQKSYNELNEAKLINIQSLNRLIWFIQQNSRRMQEQDQLMLDLSVNPTLQPLLLQIIKLLKTTKLWGQYQSKNKKVPQQVDKNKLKIQELQRRVIELTKQNKNQSKLVAQANQKLIKLSSQLEQLTLLNKNLQQRLQTEYQDQKRNKDKNSQLITQKLNKIQQQMSNRTALNQNEKQNLKKQMQDLQEIAQLKRQLDKKAYQINVVQKQLDELKVKFNTCNKQNESNKTKINNLQKENDKKTFDNNNFKKQLQQNKQKLIGLQKQSDQSKAKQSTLQRQLDKKLYQISRLEKQIQQNKLKYANFQKETDQNKSKQGDAYLQQIAQLKREIDKKNYQMKAGKKQTDQNKLKLTNVQKDLDKHKEKLATLQSNLQKKSFQINALQTQLQEISQKYSDSKKQNQKYKTKQISLQRQNDKKTFQNNSFKKQQQQNKLKFDSLYKQIDDSKAKQAALQRQLDQNNYQKQRFKAQLQQIKSRYAGIQKQSDQSKVKQGGVQMELAKTQVLISNLQKQLSQTKAKLSNLLKQYEDSKQRQAFVQRQNDKKGYEIITLTKEIDQSKLKFADLHKQIDDDKIKQTTLQRELDKKAYQISGLNKDLVQIRLKYASFQKQSEENKLKQGGVQVQLNKTQILIQSQRKEIQAFRLKYQNLQKQYDQLKTKLNNLHRQNDKKSFQINVFKKQIDQARVRQDALQRQLDKKSSTITKIQNQLEESKIRHLSLQKQIDQFRIKYTNLQKQNMLYKQDENTLNGKLRQQLLYYQNKANRLQTEVTNHQIAYIEIQTKYKQNLRILAQAKQHTTTLNTLNNELNNQISKLRQKIKNYSQLQNTVRQLQVIVKNYQSQKNSISNQIKDLYRSNTQLDTYNSELRSQLSQAKADLFSIQLELHGQQVSRNHLSQKINQLHQQLRQKQSLLDNLLFTSKQNANNLTNQIAELRQQLLQQQKRSQKNISDKNHQINILHQTIIQRQNTIRSIQGQKSLLELKIKQLSRKTTTGNDDWGKDKQIQYLNKQVQSVQQFLNDLTIQYKQLQYRYQQQKYKNTNHISYSSGNAQIGIKITKSQLELKSPSQQDKWKIKDAQLMNKLSSLDNNQNQGSVQLAIEQGNSIIRQTDLSSETRQLLNNNRLLTQHIEQLRNEKQQLLNKINTLPQQEWVIELIFNILLKVGGISGESDKGTQIWNKLMSLHQQFNAGELFMGLQAYCQEVITSFKLPKYRTV